MLPLQYYLLRNGQRTSCFGKKRLISCFGQEKKASYRHEDRPTGPMCYYCSTIHYEMVYVRVALGKSAESHVSVKRRKLVTVGTLCSQCTNNTRSVLLTNQRATPERKKGPDQALFFIEKKSSTTLMMSVASRPRRHTVIPSHTWYYKGGSHRQY